MTKRTFLGTVKELFGKQEPEEEQQQRDDSHRFLLETRQDSESFYVRFAEALLKGWTPHTDLFHQVLKTNKIPKDSTMEKYIQLSNEVDAEFATKDLKKSMVEKIGGSITNGAKSAKNWIGSKLPTFKKKRGKKQEEQQEAPQTNEED